MIAWRGRRLIQIVAIGILGVVAIFAEPIWLCWNEVRARHLLRARDSRALGYLQQCLWLDGERSDTLFMLARVDRRAGRFERALALLQRAQDCGGDSQRAERERSLIQAQSGNLRSAEPALDDLLMAPQADGPDICDAYVQGYLSNRRMEPAKQLLDVWEEDFPDDPQCYFMQARMYEMLELWVEASNSYRNGLELAPTDSAMRFRLASVLLTCGKTDEAGRLFQTCVEQRPNEPEFVTGWADFLVSQGEFEQACNQLDAFLARTPTCFEAQRSMGQVELAQSHFENARSHFAIAAEIHPNDVATRRGLGIALRGMGREEEAQRHFDYVAEVERSLARINELIESATERPDDAQIRYEIGVALLRCGMPNEGVRWLRAALELAPNHQAARDALTAFRTGFPAW